MSGSRRKRTRGTGEPPDEAVQPEVLGRLGGEPYDTTLRADAAAEPAAEAPAQPSARRSHRRDREADHPIPPVMPPPAFPDDDRPQLPRGGLIVMRRSGGLRFVSHEVVVYRDGRVAVRQHAPQQQEGSGRRLGDDEVAALYALMQESGLGRVPEPPARHSPDTFVYEVAARVSRRVYRVEVADGAIPESLAPLLRRLIEIMQTAG